MVIYKLAGTALLVGSGLGSAFLLNRSMSACLSQVEGFLGLLRQIRVKVECFALPISPILAADPALLRQCGYEEQTPPKSLGALLNGCRIRDGETERLLSGFAAGFGRGYREEQLRQCEYYAARLEQRRQELLSVMPAKKRRNATLCVSGALAAVILLL